MNTDDEKIKELNELIGGKVKVLAFIGEYKNVKTKCVMHCEKHGYGNDWGTPWNPTFGDLKRGGNCPKCSGNYKRTEIEALRTINNEINDKLKVKGFIEKYKNSKTRCIVNCSIHGDGTGWGVPWIPKYNSLKIGYGCPKCAGLYKESEDEALVNINNKINDKIKVLGFLGKYKNGKTKCIMNCKIHGDGNNFGNPWNPTCNDLKSGSGCLKCSMNYTPSTIEALKKINEIADKSIKINGFIGEYKNIKTRCVVHCNIHGNGNDFETPWIPTYNSLKNGNGCPKCSKKYKAKELESLVIINKINKNLKILKFVGKYKNSQTRCIIICSIHGNASLWKNPWIPTFKDLKAGNGCPKCSKVYQETECEALININNKIHKNLKVLGFIEKYKGIKTKCIMNCKIHGNGNDWETPWNPEYNNLKCDHGCPKCAIESRHLIECIKNPNHQKSQRNIYFIKFKDLSKNSFFYKIGVSTTTGGIKKRYGNNYLKSDNIEIMESKEIETDNISALLGEHWALRYFIDERKPMFHVLKKSGGGSECFKSDITKTISLEDIIQRGRDDFEYILDELDLTDEGKKIAVKKFNK